MNTGHGGVWVDMNVWRALPYTAVLPHLQVESFDNIHFQTRKRVGGSYATEAV